MSGWWPLLLAALLFVAAPLWTPLLPPAMVARSDTVVAALAGGLLFVSCALAGTRWHRARGLRGARSARALARLDWQAFEELVAELYRRQGYVASTTPSGADGGVDVLAESGASRIVVQAKHWPRRTVGVAVVRELFALLDEFDADAGAIVTSGRISADAQAFAADKPLTLLDGDDVLRLAERLRGRRAGGRALRQEQEPSLVRRDATRRGSVATVVCPHCREAFEVACSEWD